MFDLENRDKPILKWAGGKSQLLAQLIPNFPSRFNRYIEPFMGGGAVAFALRSGLGGILNDGNPELVNMYEVVRDNPVDLMAALDLLASKYSESFYYEVRGNTPTGKIEQAARTIFLNKTGFNGLYRQNSKGGFNVPFGKRPVCPALYESENLLAVSRRLGNFTLMSGDFAEVLSNATAGDFVYCDPPYEPLSKTSAFNAYKGGGFSREDQKRLREACLGAAARGATVAISNSAAPFILELFSKEDVRFVSARRSINSKGSARGEIDEVLVILAPLHGSRKEDGVHQSLP